MNTENTEMQYIKNKKTGKIKYYAQQDLSAYANDEYELVIGYLPKDAEFEKLEETKQGQKEFILSQLGEIDRKTIRALRESASGKDSKAYLAQYENEAIALRAKLKKLTS